MVPIHPVLRRALDSWRAEGWERFTGRKPRPDDLVVPNHRLTPRTTQTTREAFYADLDCAGIPRQRPPAPRSGTSASRAARRATR